VIIPLTGSVAAGTLLLGFASTSGEGSVLDSTRSAPGWWLHFQ